jgi:hypothetical protein
MGHVVLVPQFTFTTICHCSICRSMNFTENHAPMQFATVRRSACTLTLRSAEDEFVWFQSSELVRRGRCGKCGGALAYDNEWFEPNTVWLVNAKVMPVASEDGGEQPPVPAVEYYGQHDADVCWGSRHVPHQPVSWGFTPIGGPKAAGTAAVGGSCDNNDTPLGRGVFEWEQYVLDPGSLGDDQAVEVELPST